HLQSDNQEREIYSRRRLPRYRPVDSPLLAEDVADLAQGGEGADRLDHGRQQVLAGSGRGTDGLEGLPHPLRVATRAQGGQPLDLGAFQLRVVGLLDARRPLRLPERVDADDEPFLPFDGELVLVGRALDLLLEERDGPGRPTQFLNPGEVLAGTGLEGVRQRL